MGAAEERHGSEVASARRDRTRARRRRRSDGASDEELLALVRTGDAGAYGTLFARYQLDVTRFARSMALPGQSADDLVAEAFAKTLRALRHGRGPSDGFRPYLITAVRNTAIQAAKATRPVSTGEDPTRAEPLPEPGLQELDREALRALSTLPSRWQTVVWLLDVEGRSTEEVSARLGINRPAVAALAYRARAGLREAYLGRVVPVGAEG